MAQAGRLGRSWWKDGLTLCRGRGRISTWTARRRLLLAALTVSAIRTVGNVYLRWALQDSVEVGHHPLGILVIVVVIIFIRRVLLGPPLAPRLGSRLLEHLLPKVHHFIVLPLCFLHRLVLLGSGAPFLTLSIILLHWRL